MLYLTFKIEKNHLIDEFFIKHNRPLKLEEKKIKILFGIKT